MSDANLRGKALPDSQPGGPLPDYAMPARPRRVKRVKLALLLSSLAACAGVAIIGGIFLGVTATFSGLAGRSASAAISSGDLLGGAFLAMQLSAMNFILFFITVPAAAVALGLSIARFPHRGVTGVKPYVRWGANWGAVLVGGTTFGFGWFAGPAAAFGALIAGGMIGGLAGAFCGFLFHAIVRPARQLSEMDVSVF